MDDTILQLGELGVVDIKEINQPENGTLERRIEAVERTERAIAVLKDYVKKKNDTADRKKYSANDPKQLVDRVLQTEDIRQKGQETLEDLRQQRSWYETWGEKVHVKDIAYLGKERNLSSVVFVG